MEQGRFFPENDEGVSRPRFGYRANRIAFIKIPLDTALRKEEFKIGGNFLWCYKASSRNANAQIAFDNNSAEEGGLVFREGTSIAGVDYGSIFITSAAQAGEFLLLMYVVDGGGNIRIENPGAINTTVDVSRSANLNDAADVAVLTANQSVIAANPLRRAILIGSLSTNGGALRVGKTAAQGVELLPGMSVTIESTASIIVRNDSGVTNTYWQLEILD